MRSQKKINTQAIQVVTFLNFILNILFKNELLWADIYKSNIKCTIFGMLYNIQKYIEYFLYYVYILNIFYKFLYTVNNEFICYK